MAINNSDWRKECPAKDFVCSCGIKGHFRKYCYRDGKKRNPQSVGGGNGKKTTKKEEADSKEETSHSIGEDCFSLQLEEIPDNRMSGENLSRHLPTINQP